ncbi:MAG TPA: DoxX family protein [Usitatibacteraceae bacterium]
MKNTTLWALQILTALALMVLGAAKIASFPFMVAAFGKIGFGDWFRYFFGAIEMFGALALLIEGYAAVTAMLLAYLMLGALIAQIWVVGGNPLAVLLLLIANFTIALGRFGKSRYLGHSLLY